jgi:hypothetical protein
LSTCLFMYLFICSLLHDAPSVTKTI